MERPERTTVEFSNGPYPNRPGWELVRIAYNPQRPEHLRQVDAAITAMVKARGSSQGAEPSLAGGGRE